MTCILRASLVDSEVLALIRLVAGLLGLFAFCSMFSSWQRLTQRVVLGDWWEINVSSILGTLKALIILLSPTDSSSSNKSYFYRPIILCDAYYDQPSCQVYY